MDNFKVNFHASICIRGKNATIYIDPLNIDGTLHDADLILITHSHHDHLSNADIKKVMNSKTHFIAPSDCVHKLSEAGIYLEQITEITDMFFATDENALYFDNLNAKLHCFRAYNLNKWRAPSIPYHPKGNNWTGYIIELDDINYAICGDTDFTPELTKLKNIDVLFVPIGGTYTMTAKEAACCVNTIKPKLAVPTHYNSGVVGNKEDEKVFIENLDKAIDYKIVL